jgi:hypothetical protein
MTFFDQPSGFEGNLEFHNFIFNGINLDLNLSLFEDKCFFLELQSLDALFCLSLLVSQFAHQLRLDQGFAFANLSLSLLENLGRPIG